jgi:hypothetical protein
VPYLLGFHPSDSVVVVAMRKRRLVFAARADLPPAGAPPKEVTGAVGYLAAMVAHQDAGAATVIGYGPADSVDAVMPLVRDALRGRGIEITELLRACEGRFWSYLCDNPECCPPEGTPYDPATSPVAAAATYAGQIALPDRTALVRQVAPIGGLTRESMRQATLRAEHRLSALLDESEPDDLLGRRALTMAGAAAVTTVLDRARSGDRPSDDEVAWLTLLLAHVDIRDSAWRQVSADDWQVALWRDVVRRAEPDLVPAPASLLAFAAWRVGHGALANVALDRALREDPAYSLALLLRQVVDGGVPPSVVADWPRAMRWGTARGGPGRATGERGSGGKRAGGRRRRAARR